VGLIVNFHVKLELISISQVVFKWPLKQFSKLFTARTTDVKKTYSESEIRVKTVWTNKLPDNTDGSAATSVTLDFWIMSTSNLGPVTCGSFDDMQVVQNAVECSSSVPIIRVVKVSPAMINCAEQVAIRSMLQWGPRWFAMSLLQNQGGWGWLWESGWHRYECKLITTQLSSVLAAQLEIIKTSNVIDKICCANVKFLIHWWCFRYATQNIDLDYRLQPFIPDFIPAVGDIDAFIKVVTVHFTSWSCLFWGV
jgi:Intraflagellar transport complex B protein 46 C terminal